MRMSLLENAYDFLNEALRSAERAGTDPQAWKFAVLHVVQAIELLLKARLEAEHHVLIYEDVDRRTKTVSLDRAVERITGAAGINLTRREVRSIAKARKWRDAIVQACFLEVLACSEMSRRNLRSVTTWRSSSCTRSSRLAPIGLWGAKSRSKRSFTAFNWASASSRRASRSPSLMENQV